MKNVIAFVLACCTIYFCDAQGCVAIRSNGATCTMAGSHNDSAGKKDSWTFSLNSRYFKSYKHFVGRAEQHEREESGTEVINYSFATDIALIRTVNERWSVALFAPVISNIRSSMYEHYGNSSRNVNARRTTKSFGIGDVRAAVYYWVNAPGKKSKLNLQVGAGIKLPTGDYRFQDYFWKNDSTKLLGPVDQSIQLGDGGTGFTTEYNMFYSLNKYTSLYTNGYYLFNPREHNGVSTARGGTPSATAMVYGSEVMSVPDQFMFRLGANHSKGKFLLSAGLRIEGVPSKDVIGGSNGFRRPGYVISLEPVTAYRIKNKQLYISIPYAIDRNRTQSVPDKIRTRITGTYAQGDAAFADYSVNVGIAINL